MARDALAGLHATLDLLCGDQLAGRFLELGGMEALLGLAETMPDEHAQVHACRPRGVERMLWLP